MILKVKILKDASCSIGGVKGLRVSKGEVRDIDFGDDVGYINSVLSSGLFCPVAIISADPKLLKQLKLSLSEVAPDKEAPVKVESAPQVKVEPKRGRKPKARK